jgi:predicted DNA binding CopG/RHH family protein
MQAAEELELRPSPGADPGRAPGCVNGREPRNTLPGELPFEDTALPWWERPPFSPSTDFVSSSFARVLSSVTVPPAGESRSEFGSGSAAPVEAWSDAPGANEAAGATRDSFMGELAEEADALSYESALRRGTRAFAEHLPGRAADAPEWTPTDANSEDEAAQREPFAAPGTDAEKRLASVTIRLSRAECAQLKQRAAEAGLTLSAYVRSCTFEAEALRAQVKEAIHAIRSDAMRPDAIRGALREDAHQEPRVEARAPTPEKNPPTPEATPFPRPAPLPGDDARRRWWQLRPHAKSLSAQA